MEEILEYYWDYWLLGYAIIVMLASCGVVFYKRHLYRKGHKDYEFGREDLFFLVVLPLLWPLGVIILPFCLAYLLYEAAIACMLLLFNRIVTIKNKFGSCGDTEK
jgi:hypothetical protein